MEHVIKNTTAKIGTYTLKIVGIVGGIGMTLLVLQPMRRAVYARLHGHSRNIYRVAMETRKRDLFSAMSDQMEDSNLTHLQIVHIGTGVCENLEFYPQEVEVTCITTSVFRTKDVKRLEQSDPRVKIVRSSAEDMSAVEDCSVDAVVSMLALCTVANPERALVEIRRVLKTEGRLYFMEHVPAKKLTVTRRLQTRYRLWWGMALYGCKLDRKIWKQIEQAGFATTEYQRFTADVDLGASRYLGRHLNTWLNSMLVYLIGPHVMGVATK